ncbi:FAD binding domain-containing protein [Fusarium austroafricanum]|uniref:FAD binding domain-containing protein n=1 Tax=Fusarium austroafricanum TaxID=2364996 RepID=A0A8H4KF69_9HYPO|nr:FAD binding domain-containing protein [Fusarium austroafricanum]
MHRLFVTVVLAVIGIFGYFSILGLIQRNGWAEMFAEAISREESSKKVYLGISPLDLVLHHFVGFFYPCVSVERPELSLFAAYFAGQALPLHTALVLEGLRNGNKSTIISFSMCWGLTYQTIPVGIIMAVYCVTHIWTSVLSASFTPLAIVDLLSIDAIQLHSVKGAMTLGYIIPTMLLALPSPSWISNQTQYTFLALWQFFPLWVSLWQFALASLVRFLDLVPASAQRTSSSRLGYGRRVYCYILSITSVFHLGPLLYIISPQLRAAIFTEARSADFGAVFMPMSVLSPHLVESIAEGCQSLLQYDMYCASSAALVWVGYLSYVSSGQSMAALAKTAFKSMARMTIVGPGGAVLWALWDRDEDALRNLSVKEKI